MLSLIIFWLKFAVANRYRHRILFCRIIAYLIFRTLYLTIINKSVIILNGILLGGRGCRRALIRSVHDILHVTLIINLLLLYAWHIGGLRTILPHKLIISHITQIDSISLLIFAKWALAMLWIECDKGLQSFLENFILVSSSPWILKIWWFIPRLFDLRRSSVSDYCIRFTILYLANQIVPQLILPLFIWQEYLLFDDHRLISVLCILYLEFWKWNVKIAAEIWLNHFGSICWSIHFLLSVHTILWWCGRCVWLNYHTLVSLHFRWYNWALW